MKHEFMALLERHRNEFYRYTLRTVWDSGVAEDTFAAAMLAGWENFHKFRQGTNFRAWMYRIITNKCFVANREIQRTPKNIDDVPERHFARLHEDRNYRNVLDDPDHILEQCGDEVYHAFRKLSTAQRTAILLRSIEQFSYQEIAEIMEIPVGTVMTHLSRGRAKLRTELMDYAMSEGIVREMPRILARKEARTDEKPEQRVAGTDSES
jgi:RNA polymerase sigma-70 factor, ECF subfamily